MSVPDLSGLLAALTETNVKFVVVGGVALAAHEIVRATEDVDIVPDPDSANIDALVNTLLTLDARLTLDPSRGLGPAERRALHQGRNLSVSTTRGDLDILMRMPGVPSFAELEAEAFTVTLTGVELRVCSRDHLIRMKRARGSALDRADLERLEPPGRGRG